MSDKISVAELDEQLDALEWEQFATHKVDGITSTDIGVIKKDHKCSVTDQKIALYSKWLKKCETPTWEKVVVALKTANENVLACILRLRKICKHISENLNFHSLLTQKSASEQQCNKVIDKKNAPLPHYKVGADEIIRRHYNKLQNTMTIAFKNDFEKLIGHCFTIGLISELSTKAAILDDRKNAQTSVREFLDLIMLKLKEFPNRLPIFLDSLKKCDSLCDIAEDIQNDWETCNLLFSPSHDSLPFSIMVPFNWKRFVQMMMIAFLLGSVVACLLPPPTHSWVIDCFKLEQSTPFSPVYRHIKKFHELWTGKVNFAEPLYTSHGGYQFTISLQMYNESYISLYVHLLHGKNDDILPFPVNAIATVLLLNRNLNKTVEQLIQFDDSLPEKNRSISGIPIFISNNTLKNSDTIQVDGSVCLKIFIDPYQLVVPDWYSVDPAILSSTATLPHVFTLVKYSQFKQLNIQWSSKPFYSSNKGYKLQLLVDANGQTEDAKGTHLSILLVLLKGEYDEQLSTSGFPINVTITVRLLNWAQDAGHEWFHIPHYQAPLECRNQVIHGNIAPCGYGPLNFVPHSRLEDVSDTGYQFIKNDSVFFEVTNLSLSSNIQP